MKFGDKFFFRKKTTSPTELEIASLLMKYPIENVVKIYRIFDDYIDMELLDTDYDINLHEFEQSMNQAKNDLQRIGIAYDDWKEDNIGCSEDGVYKVFDFDTSYIFDTSTGKVIHKPNIIGFKIFNNFNNLIDFR